MGFVRVFAKNRAILAELDARLTRLVAPWWKLERLLRKNTRPGSKKNVRAHYDLGNDFYRLFLDDSMSYSCAVFQDPNATLEQAQLAKIDRILDDLALQPGERLLEIGSGWGALAIRAAGRGASVTTATISMEQARFVRDRVRCLGLEDRITVLLADYRELSGSYDKLVSVEMLEAVGHEYYDEFFRRISERLTPRGRALIQTITIPDQLFEKTKDEVDFIKRHVFPGSCLPSIARLMSSVTKSSDLRLTQLRELGPHYAPTLRAWRERFLMNRHKALALGHDERFLRGWEFYLALSEGAFRERYIGDAQLLFAKPKTPLE